MVNPRPVPPYLRVVEESACVKRPEDHFRFVGVDSDTGVHNAESEPTRFSRRVQLHAQRDRALFGEF
jgi:hypothetical protein